MTLDYQSAFARELDRVASLRRALEAATTMTREQQDRIDRLERENARLEQENAGLRERCGRLAADLARGAVAAQEASHATEAVRLSQTTVGPAEHVTCSPRIPEVSHG